MYCKHYTRRKKEKRPYCKLNKEWNPICQGCKDKAYKKYKPLVTKTELKAKTKLVAKSELKKVSKKHAKSERERSSIITNDLKTCIENNRECSGKVDIHEIYGGKNRGLSKRYKLVIPLCRVHHEDATVRLKWRVKGRKIFMDYYNKSEKEFQEIFQIK